MGSENVNQKALRKWIWAGIQIPEVCDLNGDAGYILCNMIAKYTLFSDQYAISAMALEKLLRKRINLEAEQKRKKFYGRKKPFMYEHSIPAKIIRSELLKSDRTEETVQRILSYSGQVVLIHRLENNLLKKAGLNSAMPSDWKFGDDQFHRYYKVGIKISNKFLNVTGAVYR